MKSARDEQQPKIGSGHGSAMFRQGLAELRGAFFNESNVAQPAQYGLYGTRTPGEVAESRRADAREAELAHDLNEEPRSILTERLQRLEKGRDGRGPESPNLDKE